MNHKSLPIIGAILLATPLFAGQSPASQSAGDQPDTAALLQKIRDLENRLIAVEGEVRQLKGLQSVAQPVPARETGTATPVSALPQPVAASVPNQAAAIAGTSGPQQVALGGAGPSAAKALNPDISAIGNFIGTVGHNPVQPSPALQMHETEVGLRAILDPYARGDFFLSFGEEGVNLEEGYITFTSLPAGIVAQAGKMRSAFGKVNLMHSHTLPWIDRPLVTENLLGGEDGINDAGFSVQRILPAPKGVFLEATGQLFRGDAADVFKASSKNDVSMTAHLRSYKDITESTNLDVGFSYSRGHNELGSDYLTHLYGMDATLRWKPLRRSIYHSFILRSEFVWSQRQQTQAGQNAFGFYASADYQLGRRWFLGGRYDHSGRSRSADTTDRGGSLLLSYWPSEFSQIRGQYRFTRYGGDTNAHEFLIQLLFSLGAHGAHPF